MGREVGRWIEIAPGVAIPRAELEIRSTRSGGPGGQNVNKVETTVVVRFRIDESQALDRTQKERLRANLGSRLTASGDLIVRASEHRERGRNLDDALERLAAELRRGLHEARPRRATAPTRASRRRRLEQKRLRSGVKEGRRRPGSPDGG